MDLKNYKHIHFLGIGGIGISAIAEIMKDRGAEVSGSDMKESTVTDHLRRQGITVYIGHDAKNAEGADLLVYSNAVSMENPEILKAKEMGIPVISRAQALGILLAEYPNSIAVSGTHGKTTTTSMVSLILQNAGKDPTITVGGILNELHGNVRIGGKDYFITEACEYMDSFLELRPRVEIILNIDSDHLDYFKDINHITRSFRKFALAVPKDGTIIAYDANPFVKAATADLDCAVKTFGFSEGSDFYAKNISFDAMGHPSYDLYTREGFVDRISLSVPGEHNVANSLAAIAAAFTLGVTDLDVIKNTLLAFKGTQRRFDIMGRINGFTVVDDYAHHPTEIMATLAAAQKLDHERVWCLFQPHTYTRTLALMDQFADAFKDADIVCLAEIYAAREKNIYKLSSAALMEDIKKRHPDKDVRFIDNFKDMADYVLANAKAGDVVITMGAGDIYRVGEMILGKGEKA
ncbi:MAG: UDP-N-acetylmuramate--L-alanine ligase [Clostridia bacterium]|nr:UDP-N-acetylmuramate--L-alanine ligase [Clostridia bacterium]